MSIQQFTRYGYAYDHAATLSATYAVLPLTIDATNSSRSSEVPNDAYLESVEFEISSIAGSAATVTVYLSRDSAGDVPITTTAIVGAAQAITTGLATATDGAVVFTISKDYHYDPSVGATTPGTLYVVAKTNTGGCTANVRLNWRA
tara:strand:+ start:2481 stop:2918 length:438 start_codon:yes stop_codon:yes gene_type:complete